MLVDTHCHLNFDSFEGERKELLQRAREAGVTFILNPGVDLESSREAVALAEKYEEVYAAVGVHPNDALSWKEGTREELRELSQHPKVLAIGEIGLDYYRDRAPEAEQKKIFQEQLLLAMEVELPVIIHTRDASREDRRATADVLGILNEWQTGLAGSDTLLSENPGVLHSFSADEQSAFDAIHMNFMIGITGPVTFLNAPELQRLVAALPLERVLTETDAPFLTPHPHRGERNEPAYVRLVAEKIAQLHNLPPDVVADITAENAGRLFHWRVIP